MKVRGKQMAGKNTADIGFEKQIWDAACVLRGNMDASEYKNVVLGLIFLKYISDRFDEKYQALVEEGKTLFIDARKMGTMVSRKLRELTDEDIKKIADTYQEFVDGTMEDVKGFCAAVDMEEIEKQDYILTPGRYVGIEEQEDDGEPFEEKMTRLTTELSELFAKSHELEDEIRKKLGAIGYEI